MSNRGSRSTARPNRSPRPWTAPRPRPASTNFERQLAERQAEVQALQERLKHAVEITPDKQHEFATVAQAEGVSLSVARRLLRVMTGPRPPPSVATLGRATLEAGKQAGPLARGARRGGPARGQAGHRRRDFFGRKPVLMVVEPESLCWLTGRMVEARDGVDLGRGIRPIPGARGGGPGRRLRAWAKG